MGMSTISTCLPDPGPAGSSTTSGFLMPEVFPLLAPERHLTVLEPHKSTANACIAPIHKTCIVSTFNR